MIKDIPRRSVTDDDEKAVHLSYNESAELTAMVESEAEDPTGEAYLEWFKEQAERRVSKQLGSVV